MVPQIRSEWVSKRTDPIVTQMCHARVGIITKEMEYVARHGQRSYKR
jgi:hypothetical protein